MPENDTDYNALLNSTVVDPNNIPEKEENIDEDDTTKAELKGAGMDTSNQTDSNISY